MATRPEPARAAPLWAVLTLAAFGSLGTGGVTNGISFLTESALGYGRRENYWLALFMGVTYIGAAAFSGRILRAISRKAPGVSTRAVLAAVLGSIGVACLVPPAATALLGPGQAWSAWVLIGVFSPATGFLWPIIESYLSGGRRGATLRSAIGRFNVVWAGAIVVSFWVMGPWVRSAPLGVLVGLGIVHFGCIGLLWWLPRSAGRHDPHAFEHEPHPDSYRTLLGVFRVFLPVTYVVLATLGPFFPKAVDSFGVADAWRTPVVSVWMIARVCCFALFERWHGWHGRWWAPVLGWVLLIGGFAGCVLGPRIGADAGFSVFLGGLACVGVGMAIVYVGALYYGMEVGHADVDAGGTHEALIGFGYAAGPGCGLIALWVTSGTPERFNPALVAIVAAVCLAMSAGGVFGVTRRAVRGSIDPPGPIG